MMEALTIQRKFIGRNLRKISLNIEMSVKISPLISIIIPTYNAGATLAVALESIINQTFKNWEVLIIDGLSTDHTIGIAEKFQNQFSDIQIFSESFIGF